MKKLYTDLQWSSSSNPELAAVNSKATLSILPMKHKAQHIKLKNLIIKNCVACGFISVFAEIWWSFGAA